jgi:hypothetical protein
MGRNVKDQFDNQFTSVPRYPVLQHISKPFDILKSGTWQGKEICEMIRTPVVNCASILVYSKYDGKTVAETATCEMVIGAVRALCELLVCKRSHSDLSLNPLHDGLKQIHQKKGIFREHYMLKSAMPKVDDFLATESKQLWEQRIYKIHAAKEALVYGAEQVSTTKCRQFQVRLTRAQQAATTS